MKKIMILLMVMVITGCATHAEIEMPGVSEVYNEAFDNKTLSYQIMYSQPEPGMFNANKQMPMKPLKESKLSVASSATLRKMPEYIFEQLPTNVKRGEVGFSDYNLLIELTAKHKKGPAYADYEAMKSFGKSFLTLGLGSAEYDIIADFNVQYSLIKKDGTKIYSKKYTVNDRVDHERGKLESFNAVNDYSGKMLEKHLVMTLNDFFNETKKYQL